MSDSPLTGIQSVSHIYYSYEGPRYYLEEESKRVEEIIEEEKLRELKAAEEGKRIEEEKLLEEALYSEKLREEEILQQQKKTEEESFKQIREASLKEIERWIDFEMIRQLEQRQGEKEARILEDLERERIASESTASGLSEYLPHEEVYSGININLLA